MIPARLGSKRVAKKNLRLIDGKPLISYILDTVKKCKIFDEIYLNSESSIFENIAIENNIKFYRRPEKYASDESTNDDFALDFMNNIKGDILVQILPTSPLIGVKEIEKFVKKITDEKIDTLISVEHKQIACLYQNKELNFNKYKINPPSQVMDPVKAYATALMGWNYNNFKSNMKKYGAAYHGGDGKVDFFELRGLSTIDIDREEDFLLIEDIILSQKQKLPKTIQYYDEKKSKIRSIESHVESILKKDGVAFNDLYDANKEVVALKEIIESNGNKKSWSKRLIDTESNSMTIICQQPGEGNRRHYHPNWNEWWYIVDGEWEWEIEGETKSIHKGDVVFMRKNRVHKITAVGNKPAIRMAVSRADVDHVYPEERDK